MHPYGVRDVERLLRLPRSTIRSLIAAGFVSPARGPRGAWRFSFQDLIVLRTAQALADTKVPQRRITRSLRELRRHLPAAMPLSGLSISAVADRVVVREGGGRWQADSGQYVLEFGGDPADGTLSVIERKKAVAPNQAPVWFEKALALERKDVEGARMAYEHAIDADSKFLDAYINLLALPSSPSGNKEGLRGIRRERVRREMIDVPAILHHRENVGGAHPASSRRDAYRQNLIFSLVKSRDNRGGRDERDLMFG